jgi:hypothetical protein
MRNFLYYLNIWFVERRIAAGSRVLTQAVIRLQGSQSFLTTKQRISSQKEKEAFHRSERPPCIVTTLILSIPNLYNDICIAAEFRRQIY